MIRDLDSLTAEMELWISQVLPERSPFDTATKIVEEASELLHALHHKGDVASECADILVLLLDVALLEGFDLQEAFEKKMEINRNRTWERRNGSLKHQAD